MAQPKPTQEQIDELENKVAEQMNIGGSKFPGMTYEEGIKATLDWLDGRGSDPMED